MNSRPNLPGDEPHSPSGAANAVGLVRKLAAEIASGEVRLPSFPGFATRVQKVLEDPRAAPAQIAQVIAADAALAARILRLANSAFMNPAGRQIKDLKRAVTQLGHQLVRCTAVSFALRQMELDGGSPEVRSELQQLWRQGMLVASIAYVLARETRAATADEALVAGLMHNIGRLYITVSSRRNDAFGADNEGWEEVIQEWHPRIAHAILTHWEFPPSIIAAVGDQNSWNLETAEVDPLTDVLIAATALVPCVFDRKHLDDTVASIPSFRRLGLGAARCQRLMADSAQQIRSLQAALSG